MVSIEEMYENVLGVASQIDNAVLVLGTEGNSGVVIGSTRDIPQNIEVEFHGPVDEAWRGEFDDVVAGTDWKISEEDPVFESENEGGGILCVYRDIAPDEKDALGEDFEERTGL